MSDGGMDNKERNREIARNEEKRQTIGAIRVSSWAVVFAIIIGLFQTPFLGTTQKSAEQIAASVNRYTPAQPAQAAQLIVEQPK